MTARIQTYSGLLVDPLHLSIQDIRLEDIAHALSNLCRFTGHVRTFYSVAEHSVWVSRLVPEWAAKYALIHDASEAYLQDIPSPLKALPAFAKYRKIEQRAMGVIREALKVPVVVDPDWPTGPWRGSRPDEDKHVTWRADNIMLNYEAKTLMNASWASDYAGEAVEKKLGRRPVLGLSPDAAKDAFLARAAELGIS